jgi:ABC-type lipoprotein release transport system permease subunit
MKNFKITNLKSKVVHYMNESEKKQFFTKNSLGNYKWESWEERRDKKIHDFAFSVAVMAIFTFLLFLMCGTLGFIDSLIF